MLLHGAKDVCIVFIASREHRKKPKNKGKKMKKPIKALIATATLAATVGLGTLQYNIVNPEPVTQSYQPMSPSQEYAPAEATTPAPVETEGDQGYVAEVSALGNVTWYSPTGTQIPEGNVPWEVRMAYPFTLDEQQLIAERKLEKQEYEKARRELREAGYGFNY